MTTESRTHLSEEALDDVLIGLGSPESETHLAACPECRAQVRMFRGDVQLFNAASMAWSESRRTAPQPNQDHGVRARTAFVSWAAMAAVLALMAFAIWHHHPAPAPNQANQVQAQPVDSEAQIAEDNQLLQAVNAAISPDEVSPLDEYKILESPHPQSKARSNKRMK